MKNAKCEQGTWVASQSAKLSWGKTLAFLSWSWTSHFFHEIPFFLEWKLTDKWLFRLDSWQSFSQKWTKWACHSKEKNRQHRQYLLLGTEFKLSAENWNFGKCASFPMGLDWFPVLKYSSNESSRDVNTNYFWYCIMQYVSIWKMFITQNQYFPNDEFIMLQN